MKVSVQEALGMYQAVQQLDSINNGEKVILYKYDAKTRLTLAGARRKLRAIQEDYTEARNKLIDEISDGKGIPPINGDIAVLVMHNRFARADINLMKSEIDLDIEPIEVEAFKLDENPIPAGVLDGLGSLLKV